MLSTNVNVSCQLGQGTRARCLGWPEFPPGTKFDVQSNFFGARVRIPQADPLCVFVEITSTTLRNVPLSQPKGLPSNVIELPMYDHRSSTVDISGLQGPRKTVAVKLLQLPMRPANVLTTYSVQGSQFEREEIFETSSTEFYTQISRCKNGLDHISFTRPFPKDFKPAARTATEAELAWLQVEHSRTAIDFGLQSSSSSAPSIGSSSAQPKTTNAMNPPPAPSVGSRKTKKRKRKKKASVVSMSAADSATKLEIRQKAFKKQCDDAHVTLMRNVLNLPGVIGADSAHAPTPETPIFPGVQIRVRVVDLFENDQSPKLVKWLRSLGAVVEFTNDYIQIGWSCGCVAACVVHRLRTTYLDGDADFMTLNVNDAASLHMTIHQYD